MLRRNLRRSSTAVVGHKRSWPSRPPNVSWPSNSGRNRCSAEIGSSVPASDVGKPPLSAVVGPESRTRRPTALLMSPTHRHMPCLPP